MWHTQQVIYEFLAGRLRASGELLGSRLRRKTAGVDALSSSHQTLFNAD
jgi:hypothetical protein